MSKKTLYLLRHAKASWKQSELVDRQRPLSKRGHRNAADMANRIAATEKHLDAVISSPAKRALHTAQYFANELDFPSFDIQIDERLYFCGLKGWLQCMKAISDDNHRVLLAGHNPEVSQAISWLTGKECEAVSSCTITKLKLKLEHWSELKEGCAELAVMHAPKDSIALVSSLDDTPDESDSSNILRFEPRA